jgi:DNA primase
MLCISIFRIPIRQGRAGRGAELVNNLQIAKMSVIDDVKQRADIVEVISEYVRLTKSGRTFRGLCPFHSEKNPSFYVYPEQQTWHCFGACSTGGDAFSFIMKKQGVSFGEALRLLADRAGITVSKRSVAEAEGKERLYQANQAAAQYFHNLLLNSPAGEKARRYLSSRGLSTKAIGDFQLGYSLDGWDALKRYLMDKGYIEDELLAAGLIMETEAGKIHDRFRHKLMFPITDARGRVTGFGARVLDESLPKYINSPQTPIFDKSSSLYGINLAQPAIRQQNMVVLVEGYMDVIMAHQHGFANVVATMGTSLTDKQINTIKKLTRNVVLALDADAAGGEAMLRGVNYENTLEAEVKVVILPEGKDPDEVIKEDGRIWEQLVSEALPVIDYIFNTVTSKLDLAAASGKSLAGDKLLPIIAEIRDDIRRDHYLNKLAALTGVSYRNLEAALGKIRPDRRAREPKAEATARALQPIWSSPVEENCLALLVQHFELKAECQGLLPEYFEDTRNREIFAVYNEANDLASLKARLDGALAEHFDSLVRKSLRATQIERRYAECILRLREKYFRSLETKKAQALASAAEAGGSAAELVALQEQGIETSLRLGEVFTQRGQIRSGAREVRNNGLGR